MSVSMSACAGGRQHQMPDRRSWLHGRVAVVTGASRGIGRATAEAMARAGAHVVLAARSAPALTQLAEAIQAAGGSATPAPGDVSRAADVDRVFALADDRGGAVDTDLLRQANPSLKPGLKPADVAQLIVTLLDQPMDSLSGANIPLFSNR